MWLSALIRDHTVAERLLRHLGRWSRGPPPDRYVVAESAGREPPDVQ